MIKKSIAMMVVLIMLGLLVACAGPVGPAGSAGPAGPAGSAGPPGKDAVIPTTTVVVTPASGKPGTPITLLGCGFVPGEQIEAIIDVLGAPCALGMYQKPGDIRPTINEEGAFAIHSKIPMSYAQHGVTGTFLIKITGDKGSEAVVPVDITE